VERSNIPLMISAEDTCSVASKVVSMTVKTQSTDLARIEAIQSLYREHVDFGKLLTKLGL
jgi:BioD-like phosphotransacetylase family protein